MLTRKQHDLLMLIHERLQEEGIPPSFEEMKVALDLKSKSGIHRLITALEERGFIRRLPNRARALEVIRLPDGVAAAAPSPVRGVIEGGLSRNTAGMGESERGALEGFPRGGLAARYGRSGNAGSAGSAAMAPSSAAGNQSSGAEIPVMGRIAAGVPIAAIQQVTRTLPMPPDLLGKGTHFALEVQGDSMVEAGILDGDIVIVRETSTADPGDIVVALVDDEEATLKTFKRDKGMIALEAANPAYETRLLPADRVKVQGKLAGLVRRY